MNAPYPSRLAHGAENASAQWLVPSPCDTAFGPGLYLTADFRIPEYYAKGREGTIHIVDLQGESSLTLNLDRPFAEASSAARRIVETARVWLSAREPLDPNAPARQALHGALGPAREPAANPCLAQLGIWMVYGHLSAVEQSGRMDQGVQYCVIQTGHLKPVAAISIHDRGYREQTRRWLEPTPPAPAPLEMGMR